MKTKVRLISAIVAASLSVCSLGSLAGCNNKPESPTGPQSIEISYTKKSFGDAWIIDAVERFNEAFKDQGYSAVITRNDPVFETDSVTNEIMSYEDNTYDLYFTTGNLMNLVDESFSVLKKRGESLLEDLTDVYNSKVINLDGSEGAETVLETRHKETLPYVRYDFDSEYFKGKYYGYQWTSAYGGIAINKEVLSAFGYDHAPRTTLEVKKMCDNILTQKRNSSNGRMIYPITWGGQNTSGYSEFLLLTWMAQYMGINEYNDFFAMRPKSGTTLENGCDVYDNEGILYALQAEETFYDEQYAAAGSVMTVDHIMSDQTLVDGEALFEITGEWVYKEILGIGYDESELSGIEIISVPIISELADKIGLIGTADEKDAKLSNIIKGIDDGKTDDVIASENGVTADKVAIVREARGIYYDLGRGHQAYIPSYSDAKDVAKLFLRFISSKEFSDIVYSPNACGVTANSSASPSGNNYLNSIARTCRKPYSTPISEASVLSPIRYKGGITFTFEPMPTYGELAKGMARNLTEYSAEKVYQKVKDGMKRNWPVILAGAGL